MEWKYQSWYLLQWPLWSGAVYLYLTREKKRISILTKRAQNKKHTAGRGRTFLTLATHTLNISNLRENLPTRPNDGHRRHTKQTGFKNWLLVPWHEWFNSCLEQKSTFLKVTWGMIYRRTELLPQVPPEPCSQAWQEVKLPQGECWRLREVGCPFVCARCSWICITA